MSRHNRLVKRFLLAWRSAWITLVSLPVTITALLLHVLRAPIASRLIRWLHSTWIGDLGAAITPRAGWWVRALPLAAVSSGVTAYLLLGIGLNLAYPLRSDAAVTDWGGPTLLGRWAVHASGAVLFVAAAVWLLPALHALAKRWLGGTSITERSTSRPS